MGGDVPNHIGPGDAALRIDEVGESPRHVGPFVIVGAPGSVVGGNLTVDVGEQAEWEGELLGEGLVLLGWIVGDAQDLGT